MSIPPGGYSLAEFRELHGYSERTLNALRKRGLAPKETLLPNSKYTRITEADYLAWLKVISQPNCQLEEYLRRRKFYESMGRTSAKSPGHPAQIWKKFKRLKLTEEVKKPTEPPPKPHNRTAPPPKRKFPQAAE